LMSLVKLCLPERSQHLDRCPALACPPSIKGQWLVRHELKQSC
jgi:hypothetical protein